MFHIRLYEKLRVRSISLHWLSRADKLRPQGYIVNSMCNV